MAENNTPLEGPTESSGASGGDSKDHWLRVLKQVPIHTKIVVPMVALAIVPATVVGAFLILQMQDSLWQLETQRTSFNTVSRARTVQAFLEDVQQDVLFLSQLSEIRNLAIATARSDGRVAVLRRRVEQALLIFCRGKRGYYQVRYLDARAREVVRLNNRDGQPQIVPVDELQDKSDRYYTREILSTESDEIYVSPMDLNIEGGVVEVPHRPVIRFGIRVVGGTREHLGIVVINVYADYILSLLGALPPPMEAWLVDKEGRYLGYAGPSQEKRALYAPERARQLQADFDTEVVAAVRRGREQVIEVGDVLLSFATIPMGKGSRQGQWTLLLTTPRRPLEWPVRRVIILLSTVLGLAVAVAVSVTNALARPVAVLHRTIRRIAAGNVSERVRLRTGDEIEGLASDFNTMLDRLGQTQSWNAELEAEVAHKTNRLRRLQAGLARVDKLTSIGQMTAGVLHEIGNPLAALKAKIQVAEEDGMHCALVSEILAEVDRLAVFLRSFSRLAKLPEPRFEPVDAVEIVQGVQALVTQELQRRGVFLRVDLALRIPMVRGDADQLRQLLMNLILNAAEASPRSSEVRIKIDRPGQAWGIRLQVSDDGVGIAAENIHTVWDPFFTTKADGTGLGLAICRQIVEAHDGTITVRSEERVGTTVTVFLPPAESELVGKPSRHRPEVA